MGASDGDGEAEDDLPPFLRAPKSPSPYDARQMELKMHERGQHLSDGLINARVGGSVRAGPSGQEARIARSLSVRRLMAHKERKQLAVNKEVSLGSGFSRMGMGTLFRAHGGMVSPGHMHATAAAALP